MILYFLKVFQMFYPITCKCKFHADGQIVHALNCYRRYFLPLMCIFTNFHYGFVSLKLLIRMHTRRFFHYYMQCISHILLHTQPHCKLRIFCNWREDCSCHYFLVLHLYLYPLVSVYKTQTESYKRKKHKNSNKK